MSFNAYVLLKLDRLAQCESMSCFDEDNGSHP